MLVNSVLLPICDNRCSGHTLRQIDIQLAIIGGIYIIQTVADEVTVCILYGCNSCWYGDTEKLKVLQRNITCCVGKRAGRRTIISFADIFRAICCSSYNISACDYNRSAFTVAACANACTGISVDFSSSCFYGAAIDGDSSCV